MRFKSSILGVTLICLGLPLCLAVVFVLQGCKMAAPAYVTAARGAESALPRRAAYVDGLARPISDAGTFASGTEELWILARGENPTSPSEPAPGRGTLIAEIDKKEIPMPLKHTDVHASISGYIGTVEVTQQFQNPYSQKIEAVYVFPLPHNAAVNEFIMTIGERRIRGIIRERKEAEQIYAEAKQQGYVASLLTEERPNIFTQRVANIEPGKEIDVNIKYFHTLEYVDGWYEFVFPMVVGPRFNPPGSTNGIGAVARGQSGISGQDTEVHYLRPGESTSHDISLQVDIDAGVAIEEFECRTHQVISEKRPLRSA